jgi:hypothetical protein
MHDKILYRLTWLAAVMSLGHHLDHLIRGNAVGWPLTEEVNAFTASPVVYPIIATGLLAYQAGPVGPGFWALGPPTTGWQVALGGFRHRLPALAAVAQRPRQTAGRSTWWWRELAVGGDDG